MSLAEVRGLVPIADRELIPPPSLFWHPSLLHGQAHVARVLVHAFRLVEATGFTEETSRLWAAVYLHDIARRTRRGERASWRRRVVSAGRTAGCSGAVRARRRGRRRLSSHPGRGLRPLRWRARARASAQALDLPAEGRRRSRPRAARRPRHLVFSVSGSARDGRVRRAPLSHDQRDNPVGPRLLRTPVAGGPAAACREIAAATPFRVAVRMRRALACAALDVDRPRVPQPFSAGRTTRRGRRRAGSACRVPPAHGSAA